MEQLSTEQINQFIFDGFIRIEAVFLPNLVKNVGSSQIAQVYGAASFTHQERLQYLSTRERNMSSKAGYTQWHFKVGYRW